MPELHSPQTDGKPNASFRLDIQLDDLLVRPAAKPRVAPPPSA